MSDHTNIRTIAGVPVTYHYFIMQNGGVLTDYPPSTLMETANLSHEEKQGNTDGPFVPNKFRITDYYVSRARTNCMGGAEANFVFNYMGKDIHKELRGNFAYALLGWPFSVVLEKPNTQNLVKRAKQEAFSKLGQGALSGGEDLGELKETLEMLNHPLKGLREIMNRKNFEKFADVVKYCKNPTKNLKDGMTVADTWMELRYGWRPFVYGIQDIVKLVNEKAKKLDPQRICTVRRRKSDTAHKSRNLSGALGGGFSLTGKLALEHKIRAEAIVYYRQTKALSLSRKLGTDLVNMPETAWALTRASFVWDWFYSIGPWLESLRFNPEFSVLGCTVSTKIETTGQVVVENVESSDSRYSLEEFKPGEPMKIERNCFTRSVVEAEPPALPQLQGLSNLDYLKVIDGLAMLTQWGGKKFL